jgi:hypothetical protein
MTDERAIQVRKENKRTDMKNGKLTEDKLNNGI